MSSSPFELFRRNLKPLMVLLTGLAMFAFVVLPVLDSYMRSNANSGGGDEVIANFDGTPLTRSRVDYFTRNHQSTVRFLRELADETIRRGGSPKTAGFRIDQQTGGMELGISDQPSELATIRTFQFASRAADVGFELDDAKIRDWLQLFSSEMFSDSEISGMWMRSTNNQLGPYHLYDQLRHQLLAGLYLRSGYSTVMGGQGPLLTPAEQWDSFLKLNRSATVDVYGVQVDDYLPQTNTEPSPTDIKAVYEEGKNRDPFDLSPEPAFHRRYAAKFEYLVADYKPFLDAEIAKLTEEQLRAEYEKQLAGGDFQMTDAAIKGLPESAPETPDTSEPETPEPETPEPETPEPETPEPETPESKPAESKPAESKPAEPKPAEPKPAEPESDDTNQGDRPGKIDAPASDAADSTDSDGDTTDEPPEAAPEEQSQNARRFEAVQLVAMQEKDDPVDPPSSETADAETPQKADEAKQEKANDQADPAPKDAETSSTPDAAAVKPAEGDDAPADLPKGDEPADLPAGEPDATKPPATAVEPPSEDGPDSPVSDSPVSDSPASDSPASDSPAPESDDEPVEPEVKPFEDVRDSIAERLAGPEARRKMGAAVTSAANKMKRYFTDKAIYDGGVLAGLDVQPPTELDLKALGAELGLQHETIGPYDAASISSSDVPEPIARSMSAGSGMGGGGAPFGMMMFGFDNGSSSPIPRQQLYSPLRTIDSQTDKEYVTWKTSETDAYTPTLEQARDEVIMVIRRREARRLAVAAAEQIVKKSSEAADTPLADVVPEDKKDNVEEGLGPFSWMSIAGREGAMISAVPQLKSPDPAGESFMKTVFRTEPGKYGVALNQNESVVYVVKPTTFEPSIDALRVQFKQPTGRMMATMFVRDQDSNDIIRGFYESVDEETNFSQPTQP